MHQRVAVLIAASSLFSGLTFAAPGHFWEIGMEMEGMPFSMPKQKVCAPKGSKEPPVSQDDKECKVLEKKLSGNRFYWKAQCKDGLMVADITSTSTSYSGSMKMTDKSGETMAMKISGKRLGDCDYQDRSGEIAALKKQSDDMMGSFCQNALNEMQGQLLGEQCPKEKATFCQRFATPEGYDKATRNLPAEMLEDTTSGAPVLARMCKLDHAKLRPKLCRSAITASDFNFVARLCPDDRPKLCTKAVSATRLNYVSAHCPSEKSALIAEHCEGRKYSSDIEPRFANFCAQASAGYSDDTSRSSTSEAAATKPAESAEDQAVEKVQKGFKQLKGLFGF